MEFYKNEAKPQHADPQDAQLNKLIQEAMLKIYANAKDVMKRTNSSERIYDHVRVEFPQAFSTYVDDSFLPAKMYIVYYNDVDEMSIGETDRGRSKRVEDRSFDEFPLVINSDKDGLILGSCNPETQSYLNTVRLIGSFSERGFTVSETRVNQRYLDPDFLTRLNKMNDELVNHLDGLKRDARLENSTPSMTV